MQSRMNIAARAARWSATHRKAAIFGWLAFVVVSLAIGGLVGQKQLTEAESGAGESGTAEITLERAQLTASDKGTLAHDEPVLVRLALLSSRSADSSIALVGIQPRWRQVPPILCWSTRATRSPSCAARNAAE